MAAPPVDAGAVHVTTDDALALLVAATDVGAPGVVAGVAFMVAADPVPTALVAVIENVYEVPLVSPVTVQVKAPRVEHEPPVVDTLYAVITAPPLDTGADHCRATCPFPGAVTRDVGAPGVVAGVKDTGVAYDPVPAALEAATRHS
jgi:hypothetical protein